MTFSPLLKTKKESSGGGTLKDNDNHCSLGVASGRSIPAEYFVGSEMSVRGIFEVTHGTGAPAEWIIRAQHLIRTSHYFNSNQYWWYCGPGRRQHRLSNAFRRGGHAEATVSHAGDAVSSVRSHRQHHAVGFSKLAVLGEDLLSRPFINHRNQVLLAQITRLSLA